MKTSELLEHITGPMLDDRAELLAGASDQLFKTSTVLRYLNEAERKLARDAWVIEDATTPAVCQITLQEDTNNYQFHKSILHIKTARLSDTDIDLVRVGYDDNRLLPVSQIADPEFWNTNFATIEDAGRPSRYSVDMGTRILRVRLKPDTASALLKINLGVVRMPLVAMSEDAPNKEPEVPEEYHLQLASFAAGSCLANTADIDSELRSLGRSWVEEFNKMTLRAKQDRQRRQQSAPQWRFGGWARGYEDGYY